MISLTSAAIITACGIVFTAVSCFILAFSKTKEETLVKIKIARNTGDYCVVCGMWIPEGRHVCPNCEAEVLE